MYPRGKTGLSGSRRTRHSLSQHGLGGTGCCLSLRSWVFDRRAVEREDELICLVHICHPKAELFLQTLCFQLGASYIRGSLKHWTSFSQLRCLPKGWCVIIQMDGYIGITPPLSDTTERKSCSLTGIYTWMFIYLCIYICVYLYTCARVHTWHTWQISHCSPACYNKKNTFLSKDYVCTFFLKNTATGTFAMKIKW